MALKVPTATIDVPETADRLRSWLTSTVGWVSAARAASGAQWRRRHGAMIIVVWLHVPLLAIVGLIGGAAMPYLVGALAALVSGAVVASSTGFSARVRTMVAVVTLLSSSAVLVHLSGGVVESHFHFFFVVALIGLYQQWLVFAVALGYVVAYHGLFGAFFPTMAYVSAPAQEHPVLWAFIRGGFVVLAGLASLAALRLAEVEREKLERVLDAAGDGIYGVDQEGRITFANPMLCAIVGRDGASLEGAHHHEVLGHRSASGAALELADCPLCAAVGSQAYVDGEAVLQGARDAVDVEYLARPISTGLERRGSVVTVRDLRVRRILETERRGLQAERDQLASIAEEADDLTMLGDTDGNLVWMNSAGRALLGFGPTEDIRERRIADLLSVDETTSLDDADAPRAAREGGWHGESVLRARDGARIPVWVTQRLHFDARGEPAHISAVMRDLRPQRLAEQERWESERRLTRAESVSGSGSWEWDLTTGATTWSPGMYRLHGMEPGDGLESFLAWTATVHPDDRDAVLAAAAQSLEHATPFDAHYRALRADGRELIVRGRGEIIRDDLGEPVSMLGTLVDITAQHAAAEALRESEEQARSVIAKAGDAYVQFEPDGRVSEWNEQAEKLFGWTSAEALGQIIPTLMLAGDETEEFQRRVARLGDESSAPLRFESMVIHRSGREIPVEVTAWASSRGKRPLISAFVRDISERRAVERAKDEFVSVVGHELRTPLSSIHGALGLLRAGLLGELSERGQQMVELAAHSTERLTRLINDILDLERLKSGAVPLQPQRCDLGALAARSLEAMRPMADASGVRLDLDAQPVTAWADPDRVEQTITNLLSNAIKFSAPATAVTLAVWSFGGEAMLQVRDQGRGIPPEDLERIFDRFQQVDGTDVRDKAGTGLGLAISRTIVEQHGGRIWAESVVGEGTTMSFTLPTVSAGLESPEDDPMVLSRDDHPEVVAETPTAVTGSSEERVDA